MFSPLHIKQALITVIYFHRNVFPGLVHQARMNASLTGIYFIHSQEISCFPHKQDQIRGICFSQDCFFSALFTFGLHTLIACPLELTFWLDCTLALTSSCRFVFERHENPLGDAFILALWADETFL